MEKAVNPPAKDVDEYLDALPEAMRNTLQEVRRRIKEAAPEADELISYQVPTYRQKGALVHFAAFPKHCSLIFVSKTIPELFKEELRPFKISGRTIHFTPEKPLPPTLVQEIVRARIRENEELATSKKAAKKGAEA